MYVHYGSVCFFFFWIATVYCTGYESTSLSLPPPPPPPPQVCGQALEIGALVLLSPVLDRVRLLLNLIPEDPSTFSSLTGGQVTFLLS